MKLNINEINHQFIMKVVIFALFLYKRQIKQPSVYKISVMKFVKARVPWKIGLIVKTQEKLPTEEERELILNELLYGIENDYMSKVTVTFTTPLKEVTMEIDLRDEEKYQNFLYL